VLDQFTRWQFDELGLLGRLQRAQMDTATTTADLDFPPLARSEPEDPGLRHPFDPVAH